MSDRRLGPAPASRAGGPVVGAVASAPKAPAPQREPDAVAARSVPARPRLWPLASAAVVALGVVVVVAQAEEPDQPDDQQPDVEDPEADHEDPPLGGHGLDASAVGRPREVPSTYGFA